MEAQQQIWSWRRWWSFSDLDASISNQSSQFPVLGAPVNISQAFQMWTGCPRWRLINPRPPPTSNTHVSAQLISFLFHGHLLTKADHASLITAPGEGDASLRVLLWRRSTERLHKRCRADHENSVSQPPAILYHPSRDPLSISVCLFLFRGSRWGFEFGAQMKTVQFFPNSTHSFRDCPYAPGSCCLCKHTDC